MSGGMKSSGRSRPKAFYETRPTLACALAARPGASSDDLAQGLLAAKEAAEQVAACSRVWLGVSVQINQPVAGGAFGERPIGPPIDAVLEASVESGSDLAALVEVARETGRALDGLVDPKKCGAMLGTAYVPKTAMADFLLATLGFRDTCTNEDQFVHWWQVHHTVFNLSHADDYMVGYQLVHREDPLTAEASAASGFEDASDFYLSVYMHDPSWMSQVSAEKVAATLEDEKGFISHRQPFRGGLVARVQ